MELAKQLIIYYVNQISLFVGFPLLICGIMGNIMCCIVFRSLRTFRNNPCAFYLTIGSFVSNLHLLFGLTTRLVVNVFNIDWTDRSLFYCKLRPWLSQFSVLVSLGCLCLATVDQYLATCPNNSWRQKSNLKAAHRLTIIMSIFWWLHGIPFFFFYRIDNNVCGIYQPAFYDYNRIVYFPILVCALPFLVMVTFSCLSLRNIRNMNRYTVPVIQRELDRQLSRMTLTQVIFAIVTAIPFVTYYVYFLSISCNDSLTILNHQFVAALLNIIWHMGFSASFYIYYCSSRRFRKQFHFVITRLTNYLCRELCQQQNRVSPDQIAVTLPTILPETTTYYRRTQIFTPRRTEA